MAIFSTLGTSLVAWPGNGRMLLVGVMALLVPLAQVDIVRRATDPVERARRRASWTHRAQLLGPWRRASTMLGRLVAVHAILVFMALQSRGWSWALIVASASVAWSRVVHSLAAMRVERRWPWSHPLDELCPRWTRRRAVLLAVLVPPVPVGPVLVVFAVSTRASTAVALGVAAAAALAVVAYALWGYAWALHRSGVLEPAPDRFVAATHRAARALGWSGPLPAAVLLHQPWANAMALPSRNEVWYTTSLLDALEALSPDTDESLDAIAAHEVAHLTERRSSIVIRFVPLILSIAVLVALTRVSVVVVLALVAGVNIAPRLIGRRAERRADAIGVEAVGAAPYTSALAAIYEWNLIDPSTRSATHPSLVDRLDAAGVTPCFARTRPPSDGTTANVVFGLFGVTGLFAFLLGAVGWPDRERVELRYATGSGRVVVLDEDCSAPAVRSVEASYRSWREERVGTWRVTFAEPVRLRSLVVGDPLVDGEVVADDGWRRIDEHLSSEPSGDIGRDDLLAVTGVRDLPQDLAVDVLRGDGSVARLIGPVVPPIDGTRPVDAVTVACPG